MSKIVIVITVARCDQWNRIAGLSKDIERYRLCWDQQITTPTLTMLSGPDNANVIRWEQNADQFIMLQQIPGMNGKQLEAIISLLRLGKNYIYIASHSNGGRVCPPPSLPYYYCEFHRVTWDPLWVAIANFLSALLGEMGDKVSSLKLFNFNKVCEGIASRFQRAQMLRSQILTPFVLLHLVLQMEGGFDIAQEEKECYSKGIELLHAKDGTTQLLSCFKALLDLPSSPAEKQSLEHTRLSELEKEVKTFVSSYGETIKPIFKYLAEGTVSNAKETAGERKSDICTAIEHLADTLEKVVAYVEFGEQLSIR